MKMWVCSVQHSYPRIFRLDQKVINIPSKPDKKHMFQKLDCSSDHLSKYPRADVEIVVHPRILVPRRILSGQKDFF